LLKVQKFLNVNWFKYFDCDSAYASKHSKKQAVPIVYREQVKLNDAYKQQLCLQKLWNATVQTNVVNSNNVYKKLHTFSTKFFNFMKKNWKKKGGQTIMIVGKECKRRRTEKIKKATSKKLLKRRSY